MAWLMVSPQAGRGSYGARVQPQCQHRKHDRKSPVNNHIAISADGDAKCRCARVIMLVGSRVGLSGAGSVGVRPSSGRGANLLRGPRFLCFLRLLALVCFASTCAGPPSTWSSFLASFPSSLPPSVSSHLDAGSTVVCLHPAFFGALAHGHSSTGPTCGGGNGPTIDDAGPESRACTCGGLEWLHARLTGAWFKFAYGCVTHPLSNGSRRYDKPPWVAWDFPDLESRSCLLCQELTGGGRQHRTAFAAAMPLARHDSQVRNLS